VTAVSAIRRTLCPLHICICTLCAVHVYVPARHTVAALAFAFLRLCAVPVYVPTPRTVAALTSASLRLCAVYVCVRKQNAVHATSIYVQFSYYDVRCLSGVPSMGAFHTRGTEPFFFADECGGNMKKRETGKTRKARKNTREKNPQTPQQGKAITEIIICPCRLPFDHRIP
jgi:hypothetical protein